MTYIHNPKTRWYENGTNTGYFIVTFQDQAGNDCTATVFPGSDNVAVFRYPNSAEAFALSIQAELFKPELERITTEHGLPEDYKRDLFREQAEMLGTGPDLYGRVLEVPVTRASSGKSFTARYIIEGLHRNSKGRVIVEIRTQRGKLRNMHINRVMEIIGTQGYFKELPRASANARALDLGG